MSLKIPSTIDSMELSDSATDLADLKRAVCLMERPSLAIQIANLAGSPIEWGVEKLPKGARESVYSVVHAALGKSVTAALWTMGAQKQSRASTKLHKVAAAASGAVGGFFGFAGLLLELPISTTIMMRAVADVARSEGFSVSELPVQVACIEVFALGGSSGKDDAADSAYYMARGVVAEVARHTSSELAKLAAKKASHGALSISSKDAGKLLAKLIEAVAARFGIVMTEKMAAQIVPIVGAVTGATINTLFTNHYQDMARGHFIVKRLEQKYGSAKVKAAYRKAWKAAGA